MENTEYKKLRRGLSCLSQIMEAIGALMYDDDELPPPFSEAISLEIEESIGGVVSPEFYEEGYNEWARLNKQDYDKKVEEAKSDLKTRFEDFEWGMDAIYKKDGGMDVTEEFEILVATTEKERAVAMIKDLFCVNASFHDLLLEKFYFTYRALCEDNNGTNNYQKPSTKLAQLLIGDEYGERLCVLMEKSHIMWTRLLFSFNKVCEAQGINLKEDLENFYTNYCSERGETLTANFLCSGSSMINKESNLQNFLGGTKRGDVMLTWCVLYQLMKDKANTQLFWRSVSGDEDVHFPKNKTALATFLSEVTGYSPMYAQRVIQSRIKKDDGISEKDETMEKAKEILRRYGII